jgi:mediator of RNA polymerase II transcription subunit 12
MGTITLLTRLLGYPDFYPSRPGFQQAEDVLTEENVKNGFSAKAFVAVGVSVPMLHQAGSLNLIL